MAATPPPMTQRAVPAPEADWLTEAEVLLLLDGISSTTLGRYIRAGRFPSGIHWGRDVKWRWEDVAWFYLGQQLQPRLRAADADPDDDDQPDAARGPAARHRDAKPGPKGGQPPPPGA